MTSPYSQTVDFQKKKLKVVELDIYCQLDAYLQFSHLTSQQGANVTLV